MTMSHMSRRNSQYDAGLLRYMSARSVFLPVDTLFKRCMKSFGLSEISKTYGLKMRGKNTIIAPWPINIRRGATKTGFGILRQLVSSMWNGKSSIKNLNLVLALA